MTSVGVSITYRGQQSDYHRIAISMPKDSARRRKSQKYSQQPGQQTRMDSYSPVGKAKPIAPAPRHTCHTRACWLAESLEKDLQTALPFD